MPAKLSRKTPKSSPTNRRRRIVIAVVAVLVLAIGSGLLAQVTRKNRRPVSSGDIHPASFAASIPSKEYVYAGAKLVAIRERTASANGDDAAFVSMCVYSYDGSCMAPEDGLNVFNYERLAVVVMRNTGSTPWDSSCKLASQNLPNNTTWRPLSVPLPQSQVNPGAEAMFTFGVTKPVYPNTSPARNFQWQMFKEGAVGFFGEKTRNSVVQGGEWLPGGDPSPNNASFVSQSVPALMFAGQSYAASVTLNNSGTNTWTAANNYKLGSQVPQNNMYWGINRVALTSSVASGSNASFSFNAAAPSTPGLHNFQWMMVQDGTGGAGYFGGLSPSVAVSVTSRAAMGYLDYNLGGTTDLGVWRPATKQWLLDTNLNGTVDFTYTFASTTSDLPVPGDYNGDGKADLATVKSSVWRFDFDRNGAADQTVTFGTSGDIPTPQDYNGDKLADIAIFRPSTAQWLLDTNRDGTTDSTVGFGQNGDVPLPADFNGDGAADLAVFRPSTGQWLIDTDRNGSADITITLGQNGDLPVPMDYNGDGRSDPARFRPSNGQWQIDTDRNGTADITVTFGQTGDVPVAGDYNGDGSADIAVFRPSNNKWIIDTNRDGTAEYTLTLGQSSDVPLRQNGWVLKSMGMTSQ